MSPTNDDDREIIDVEAEEVVDADNLPAVIPKSSGTHESSQPKTEAGSNPAGGTNVIAVQSVFNC